MNKHTSVSTALNAGQTIGVDLGDRCSHFCVLDAPGEVIQDGRVTTSPAELRSVFSRERVEADSSAIFSRIGWVYPDRPLTPEFREILGLGKLKGADLWHLACALFLKTKLPDLAFVQGELAEALGFATRA